MPAANRPRAVWTGAISFGLVNAPVRMYTAIAEKDLRFNQLHVTDGGRIGYVKVCKVDNEPVPADEIVKGYEVSKGEYVQMSDEDFEAARSESIAASRSTISCPRPRSTRSTSSARTTSAPRRAPARPSTPCSCEAMEQLGPLGHRDLRAPDRENLACLRVRDGVITLERMFFDDEVRSIDGIAPGSAKVDKQQLKMAEDLIAAYTSDFEPGRYSDTYRDRLLEIVEQKRQGKTTTPPEPKAGPAAARPDDRPDGVARRGPHEPGEGQEGRDRHPDAQEARSGVRSAQVGLANRAPGTGVSSRT